MYKEENLIFVFTMLECIEKCGIYTDGFTNPNEFIWADEQMRLNAVISLFIAIGEESKKISQNLKDDIAMKLNWSDIAGIRDKISHDYRGVDAEILWAVIGKDLPRLKDALLEMLELIKPSKELINEFLDSQYYKHLTYLRG
jgi:uncharacterized protein with HEPN domain